MKTLQRIINDTKLEELCKEAKALFASEESVIIIGENNKCILVTTPDAMYAREVSHMVNTYEYNLILDIDKSVYDRSVTVSIKDINKTIVCEFLSVNDNDDIVSYDMTKELEYLRTGLALSIEASYLLNQLTTKAETVYGFDAQFS